MESTVFTCSIVVEEGQVDGKGHVVEEGHVFGEGHFVKGHVDGDQREGLPAPRTDDVSVTDEMAAKDASSSSDDGVATS